MAVVLGLALGLFSAYYGGLFDDTAMRIMDVLVAIPPLLLAMIILATLGPSRLERDPGRGIPLHPNGRPRRAQRRA